MLRGLRLTLLAATVLTAWGCATIVSGTTQSITVSSNVDGATIFLDGDMVGSTPFTGVVPKGKSELRLELQGYRTETVTLSKTLVPIFWGNIIIGGTLGSITDFASGAAYQYAPATYQVDLRAAGQAEEDFIAEVAVRKFSMLYVDEISRDLSIGGGDYSNALIALMKYRSDREVGIESLAAALERSGGHPFRFGREVVALE